MDSMFENEPSIEFDLSSIGYLNHQAKRLEDFSMLDSPNPKQTSSVKEDRTGREKTNNVRCFSNDASPERPLSRGVTMREQEGMICELKKECFGLKLRIYYMEEQLRETFDANIEDILKENVELKVAVEELKNEIVYKTDLLTKASQALQQMSGENDNQFQKKYDDNVHKIKNDYECKLKEKDGQIKAIEQELNHLNIKLSEWENKKEISEPQLYRSVEDEKDEKYNLLVAKKQQDEESLKAVICELEQTLGTKEGNIEILRNDLRRLASNSNPDHSSDQHYKSLCDKLEKTLSEKESALLQVKSELTCKTNLADSYKEHISNLEQNLKDNRDVSEEKELEMQKSIRQLQEQFRKLRTNIQVKEEELQVKDQALTEAKEEKLLACQQKVQFELNSIKNKDSRIIELEIKIKQQNIDLNKSIEEHSRTLKEKEDVFVELKHKYSAAQKEIARMKVEVEEYRSLTGDLKNSLEKNMLKEKNICSHLDDLLLSKSTGQKELESMSCDFIKDLQRQLKEKGVQIQEIKALKEAAASAASRKHQEFLSVIKEKELIIVELKEALLCAEKKENNAVNTEQNQNHKPLDGEHASISALLKDKNEAQLMSEMYQNKLNEKDKIIDSLTKAAEDKEKEILKMAALNSNLSEKNQIVESLTNEIKELKVSLHQLENEKVKLEAECKSVNITKKSIEEQLQTAYSQLSKKDTDSAARENELIGELEEISNIFHGVVETYKLLLEKLNNNQHPDIQLRILHDEITEVEHTQGNFKNLFRAVLNKLQVGGNDLSEIVNKDMILNIKLRESKRRNSLLKGQLYGLAVSEGKVSNASGDEISIETQTREETGSIQLEYEHTIHEKDEEISTLTRKLKQEKQVSQLLSQQKDILSQQLDVKHKQNIHDASTFKATKAKLEKQINENLILVETKDNRISEIQEEICSLQSENKDLSVRLAKIQAQLEHSNAELRRTNLEIKTAETNVISLKSQLSVNIEAVSGERTVLQKDLKELYEMNVRLKKKVKAYELVVKKKDTEKGKLKEELEKAEDKNKELEVLLNTNSCEKTALEGELQQRLRSKAKEYESISEKYSSAMSSNIELHEKVEELSKRNKLHEDTTLQEVKKLGEIVETLTQQSSALKCDLQKTQVDVDKKTSELHKLQNELVKQCKEMNDNLNEKTRLQSDLQTQSNKVDEKVREIADLEAALQKRSGMLDEKVSECAGLQDILQQQSNKNDEKEKDITSLQNILQKQLKEIDEKVIDNSKLQTVLDEATVENKKFQMELQKMHEAFENNKLVDRLASELIESKSLINSLQSQVSVCSGIHGELTRLKDEVKRLKHAKIQLKEANRKLMESAEEMSQKLSTSLEEKNTKVEEIKILKTQMVYLEEKIESFSPLYTSSAHNLAVSSSDVFTQTETNENCVVICQNNDSNSLITEHINEMKQLRRQLEETISNNDSLRNQLEERLNEVEQDVSLIHDPHLRITLIRDNDAMRVQLQDADTNEKKLKLQIQKLKEEKKNDTETINTLNSQMQELNVLSTNLKMEMEVYDRLIQQLGINRKKQINNDELVTNLNSGNDLDKNLLLALLEEIRDLRDQLQLTIDVNNQLREKLEKEFGYSINETLKTPKVSRSLFSGAILCSLNTNMSADTSIAQNTQSLADYTSLDETPTKDIGIDSTPARSSWSSNSNVKLHTEDAQGSFVIFGKFTDFKLLKEKVEVLVEKVSSCIKKMKSHKENSVNVARDMAQIRKLAKEMATLLSGLYISERRQHNANNVVEADKVKCNTSGIDIASKLLKACDTLKTTKGNLQLRNSSKPPSRNTSPNN